MAAGPAPTPRALTHEVEPTRLDARDSRARVEDRDADAGGGAGALGAPPPRSERAPTATAARATRATPPLLADVSACTAADAGATRTRAAPTRHRPHAAARGTQHTPRHHTAPHTHHTTTAHRGATHTRTVTVAVGEHGTPEAEASGAPET